MPTEEVTAFPFGEGGGFADGRGLYLPFRGKCWLTDGRAHCLPFRGRCRLCRRKSSLPSLSGKVSALPTEEVTAFPFGEDVNIAVRYCYQLKFNTAKRGFLRFEISADETIKVGHKLIIDILSLIFSLLAPLFRRMRATFSRFSPKLIFSPQSGKTFNDNSTKRNPLSAQCATLPEGESSYRCSAPLSPKGKAVIDTACHSPRKKKRFPPSGKAFYFPTRLFMLSAEWEDFFSSTHSKQAERLSII